MNQPEIPTHITHEFAPRRHDYCVTVGVLNEGDKILRQLERMAFLREHADIIIADGGSTDGATSAEKLKNSVRTLLIKAGKGGLSSQYRMAFHYALEQGYHGIVSIDGNNKDGVEAIPEFIQQLKNGADLVQGSRFIAGGRHEHTPFIRKWGIRLVFNPLIWLASGFRYTDGMNGFKAFSKKALLDERVQPFREVFQRYNLQYYLCYRLPRLGYKIVEIPVARLYPATGKTPTKITTLGGYIDIMQELIYTILGLYNPGKRK